VFSHGNRVCSRFHLKSPDQVEAEAVAEDVLVFGQGEFEAGAEFPVRAGFVFDADHA
jgi:hypothetical protein